MTSASKGAIATTTPATANEPLGHQTESQMKNHNRSMESRVQRSLDTLQSLTSPNNQNGSSKRQRKQIVDFNDFKKRLGTFQSPSIYFAKPLEISPIICARFG